MIRGGPPAGADAQSHGAFAARSSSRAPSATSSACERCKRTRARKCPALRFRCGMAPAEDQNQAQPREPQLPPGRIPTPTWSVVRSAPRHARPARARLRQPHAASRASLFPFEHQQLVPIMRLAYVRLGADRVELLEQLGGFDPDSGSGGTAMDASHEGQPIAQIALDRKARRDMAVPFLRRGVRLTLLPPTQQPLEQPSGGAVRGHRVGPEKTASAGDRTLARLRLIEGGSIDHGDVIERAGDRAVAASNALIVLKVDFPLWPAANCPGRARVHAFGIVAMAAGAGHQVLANLDTVADEPAAPVQRLAGAHAVVALDAAVEVHYQQRFGLDYPQLAAFLQQVRQLRSDTVFLLLLARDDLVHRALGG